MKTPAATKATTSAQNSAIFTYPPRKASACAEVLARLLAGEAMTSADTLEQCGTMRAAAHVNYLKDRYGVPILSEERAVGCTDGRMETVAVYRLPQATIAAARAAGAGAWCAEVRKARTALRAKAAEAYRRAAAIERTRKRLPLPGQGDLFGEGGAA